MDLSFFFFFKHKTSYGMRISDWSSDVCSSDLHRRGPRRRHRLFEPVYRGARQLPPPVDRLGGHGPRQPPRRRFEDDELRFGRQYQGEGVEGHLGRSEERGVGKEWSVRVDVGGRRNIKQNKLNEQDTEVIIRRHTPTKSKGTWKT